MSASEPVDVCIVGAGATGATVAKVLTEAGLSVVGLERGPWLKPEQFSGDELKYLNRNYLVPDPRISPRTRRGDEGSVAEVFSFAPLPQLVGGGTVHWNGWMPRPRPSDFRQLSIHGPVDGATLADWPIGYDDLEPYLTKVEWAFGCSGLAGASALEPPRSAGYPCPPVPVTSFGRKFYEGCARLGIDAAPVPQALVTTPHNGRPAARCTGFWNQYGDPTLGRSTTLTSFVPDALATGRYDLRPDSYATRIEVARDGRAKSVRYVDLDGAEHGQEASIVILCSSAIESARLLLLSDSPAFPDGLANNSGLVGRNATFHEYCYAVGMFDGERHEPLRGWTGYYLNGGSFEYYETDASRGHICGGFVAASGVLHPINWALPDRPRWGGAMTDADRRFYDYAMKIGMILHDLPQHANRVDLDPTVKDAWGLPAARITHRSHPNDLALVRWQLDRNAEILEAAGASKVLRVGMADLLTGNTTHQHGTARMGTDPAESVLDPWCRAHDVDNLYILDGSCFPTATGVNPTLTMMANAWRCADHIVDVHVRGRDHGRRRADARPPVVDPAARTTSKSGWPVVAGAIDPDSDERLFFTEHEWETVAAAVARIIPAGEGGGAEEAGAVLFIDRYLSGIDYVYAAADGSGFLRLGGKHADAWRARIHDLQVTYRAGVRDLDRRARALADADFKQLSDELRDRVLEGLSGLAKPDPVRLGEAVTIADAGPLQAALGGAWDDELTFFDALTLHTRQGFYADPVYGGNRGRIGWKAIGFPGPPSLEATRNGDYDIEEYMHVDLEWPYVEADADSPRCVLPASPGADPA